MWQVIIGGAIALSGVLFAEWLRAVQDRRDRVRSDAAALAFALPVLNAHYSESRSPSAPRVDADYFGDFWQLREKVLALLNELRWLPHWPSRNSKAIRETAALLLTLEVAVELRFHDGLKLTMQDQLVLGVHNNLHSLVFGVDPVPKAELDRYVSEGFEMPENV